MATKPGRNTLQFEPFCNGKSLVGGSIRKVSRTVTESEFPSEEPCVQRKTVELTEPNFGGTLLCSAIQPGDPIKVECPSSYLHDRFLTEQALLFREQDNLDNGLVEVECHYESPINTYAIRYSYAPDDFCFIQEGNAYSCPFRNSTSSSIFRSSTRQFQVYLSISVHPDERPVMGPELLAAYEKAGATCPPE